MEQAQPKLEAKPEIRRPVQRIESQLRLVALTRARRSEARPFLGSTPTEIDVRSGATEEGGLAQISDFGFRPSDFSHALFH